MANSNGYVREHRLVMAQHLGRPLEPWEVVHHRPPGIKGDNRIENLELVISAEQHNRANYEEILRLQKRVTLLEAENVILMEQLRELGEGEATYQ